MSILDEVMPDAGPEPVPNTTVYVNAAQTFTPRSVSKHVMNGLVVNTITTPKAEVMHYAVGTDAGVAYHMFHARVGLTIVDILAMAYRNVFMWIRPQGPNDIYYEPHGNRDVALEHIGDTLRQLVGTAADERMHAGYHDERLLEINKGEEAFLYDIKRTYDQHRDRVTTIIMALPAKVAEMTVDELYEDGFATTIQHTPSWLDPGDFLPGVWTPDPNAEDVAKPFDEFHPDNTPA